MYAWSLLTWPIPCSVIQVAVDCAVYLIILSYGMQCASALCSACPVQLPNSLSLSLCTMPDLTACAGLKIDFSKALRVSPVSTILLGVLPVFFEGFLDSAIFATLYGFPYMLAATGGFLLSAISPTVIVTGMLDLQVRSGLGLGLGLRGREDPAKARTHYTLLRFQDPAPKRASPF